jgi:hypothetical protein
MGEAGFAIEVASTAGKLTVNGSRHAGHLARLFAWSSLTLMATWQLGQFTFTFVVMQTLLTNTLIARDINHP